MIGPSDHRIPKSGKFDVTRPECLTKLYSAVAHFYRQQKPLVLCEIATARFRFFEDVDLLLPLELEDDVQALEQAWVDQLLRHRGAVLGKKNIIRILDQDDSELNLESPVNTL
jgi:hypothetical protein